MTTTPKTLACADAEPLLSALLEGEVNDDERRALTVHLAGCSGCREELTRERQLTEALRRGATAAPPVSRPFSSFGAWRLAAAALVGVAITLFALAIDDQRAYGSIAPERFAPTLTLESGEMRPLAAHNHLDVAANEKDAIELQDAASLVVVGPAVLDLDYTGDGWKLVLLRGQVQAEVRPGSSLLVSTVRGAWAVGAGTHLLSLDPPRAAVLGPQETSEPSAAELLQTGYGHFFHNEQMAAAEQAFSAARLHPQATDEEKERAHFYLAAAVGRQERYEEAIDLQAEWMEAHPDDAAFDYVLLFQGIYQQRLGREQEARASWQQIVDRSPDSELATNARGYLDAPAGARSTPRGAPDVYVPDRLLPAGAGQRGGKVVVAWGLDAKDPEHRRIRKIADEAATELEATLVDAADRDFDLLAARLRELLPESVLFVLEPRELDLRLHRRVLLLSQSLDEDAFPDFAFGWFTARDGDAIEKLWKRTRETRRRGLSSKRWTSTFVTTSAGSAEYPDWGLDLAKEAGFKRSGFGFAIVEKDAKCLDWAGKHLRELDDAGVITMTGNGDPQGIWLFDDARNADPARQWDFDPAKVGEDPEHEMPRILADQFAALELDRPVVWSGTCHSAATHRVFVEGDIVSTFGKSDVIELYEMPLEQSLALGILSGGAVALLAPIGANHGYSVDLEGEFALKNGASLGETIKSTWDDVFLQARGELHLVLPEAGRPPAWNEEPIMQGGGANRALLGDPTLRPFPKTAHPRERAEVKNVRERAFDVVVEWDRGEHVASWNLYASAPTTQRRIVARVAIDDALPKEKAARLSATLKVVDRKGKELKDFVLTHAEPEVWHGRRFLHVQALGPESAIAGSDLRATFAITWEPVAAQ